VTLTRTPGCEFLRLSYWWLAVTTWCSVRSAGGGLHFAPRSGPVLRGKSIVGGMDSPLLFLLPPPWREPFMTLVVPGLLYLLLTVMVLRACLRLFRWAVWGSLQLQGRVALVTGAGAPRFVDGPIHALPASWVLCRPPHTCAYIHMCVCVCVCVCVRVADMCLVGDGCSACGECTGSGIGRELVLQLAQQGCKVVLVDIRPQLLASAKRHLVVTHSIPEEHVVTAQCDVSDKASVRRMAVAVQKAVAPQHVSVLINNAGASARMRVCVVVCVYETCHGWKVGWGGTRRCCSHVASICA